MQRAFLRKSVAADRLKETGRQFLASLDDLFASLQHRAFRGKL
jgi:hypothetical protein